MSRVAGSSVAAGSIPLIRGLFDVWAETTGDPRVTIAVLDGPVDRTHPALVGASLTTVEVTVPAVPRPGGSATRHGTLVASLIFGRHEGESPVAGIAPGCRGIVTPVFSDVPGSVQTEVDRHFAPTCSQLGLARAILLAAEHGAQVINISGGQDRSSGTAHPILADAVGRCVRRGILVVAAAGNDGCECVQVPAAVPGVLAVGAMDARGEPLEMSNWGRSYRSEGLLAPGAGLLGARAGGGTLVVNGTSFAAALVSGAAGLLLSLALKWGRHLDGARIREILLDSAEKCLNDVILCRRHLAGRLDLARARALLRSVDSGMSDESPLPLSPSDAARAAVAAAEPSGDVGRHSAAEPVPSVPPSPTVALSEGCGCASCRAKDAASQKSCGCASCRAKDATRSGGLVFALGEIAYDLVSEARRDSIQQHMERENSNPLNPAQMLEYLRQNPWERASIHWILSFDQTPVYAIVPAGPFAGEAYHRLFEFLADQVAGTVERVSIPGRLAGQARLFNGQVLPVVVPELRGMFSWTTDALVQAVVGAAPQADAPDAQLQLAAHVEKVNAIRGFLDRVYHELRTLGVTAEERAINYAATNAFQIQTVYESAIKESMELDSIDVERSLICRPDSDCWDVKIYFFYPQRQVQTVRKVYRFTVDVSDVVPVTVGPVRSWFVR
jgi:cyanobactin maturation PatA/PatG family protease